MRRRVNLYNLDVIISVGYRVRSIRGTRFRQWANHILKEYLLNGYSINRRFEHIEQRLATAEEKIDFLCVLRYLLMVPVTFVQNFVKSSNNSVIISIFATDIFVKRIIFYDYGSKKQFAISDGSKKSPFLAYEENYHSDAYLYLFGMVG